MLFTSTLDGIACGPGWVEDGHLNEAWRGIAGAIEQDESDAGAGEVTGDDEREILINAGGVEAGILHDMAGADADEIIARQRVG